MEQEPEHGNEPARIDRRQALKRMAAGGAVLWAIPTIQTIGMRRAFALGSPGEDCFTIKIEDDGDCSVPSPNSNLQQSFGCLFAFDPDVIVTDQPESEACAKVVNLTQNVNWFVTLAPGCHLEAGFSKCAQQCVASPSPKGSTGTIQFVPCGRHDISHIEFTICCEPVA